MENATVNRMHTMLASRACMINTGGWTEISDAKTRVAFLSIMGNAVFRQGYHDKASFWKLLFMHVAVFV